jgi:hypothetical protein
MQRVHVNTSISHPIIGVTLFAMAKGELPASTRIDVTSDSRQRDKLREELPLAKIDHQPTPSMNTT